MISLEYAKSLDSQDNLSHVRRYFHIPKNSIYLCGHSLGLQPRKTSDFVTQELEDWKNLGVLGHFEAKNPWFPYHDFLNRQSATIVGALNEEVVVMNSLTVNLHLLLTSFYNPNGSKNKIIIDTPCFPSDRYAINSHIKNNNLDIGKTLVELVPENDKNYHENEYIINQIEKYGDETHLIFLSGINYYNGQYYDIDSIAKKAKEYDCLIGLDLAHAAGNVKLFLHDWDIDFSAWCTYKYLCAGPGSPSGVFIHERHHDWDGPRFLGWWGHNKDSRFQMPSVFDPILTSEGWQVSNAPVMGMAPLLASMEIYDKVGMNAIRSKGKELSSYMEYLIKEYIAEVDIITPKARGCQLSIVVPGGKDVFDYLSRQGVVCDWRNPDVIRVAPHPLFNTFTEVFDFVKILKKAIA